eukprot:2540987-Prymnesium_polylepis.1
MLVEELRQRFLHLLDALEAHRQIRVRPTPVLTRPQLEMRVLAAVMPRRAVFGRVLGGAFFISR